MYPNRYRSLRLCLVLKSLKKMCGKKSKEKEKKIVLKSKIYFYILLQIHFTYLTLSM